jgi:hypothetical protein
MAKTKAVVKVECLVVGGSYRNRRGDYTVRSVGPETVEVEYADGEKAVLDKKVQERIVRNIETEKKLETEIKWELEHPREQFKGLAEYICSFCSRPGDNSKCKLSVECKEKNTKLGCIRTVEPKITPDKIVAHMKNWSARKTESITIEDIQAEIARRKAL